MWFVVKVRELDYEDYFGDYFGNDLQVMGKLLQVFKNCIDLFFFYREQCGGVRFMVKKYEKEGG